jgi:formamidopyrimidine-DNA glycosylase
MKVYKRCREIVQFLTAVLSHSAKNKSSILQNVVSKTSKGRCAMARLDSSYLPRGNPCAQCGKPIPRPDWVESSPGRTSFLWFCRACDYRFEAVAIYEEADPDALAA